MSCGMDWRDAERDWDDPVRGETTIPRAFVDAAARHADADAQAYKGGIHERSLVPGAVDPAPNGAFAAISYAEMAGVVRALAAGFRDLGVAPGDRVGIFANTRMEWAQTDLALLSAGAAVTTVYAESSPDRVAYLLGDAGAGEQELRERVVRLRGGRQHDRQPDRQPDRDRDGGVPHRNAPVGRAVERRQPVQHEQEQDQNQRLDDQLR